MAEGALPAAAASFIRDLAAIAAAGAPADKAAVAVELLFCLRVPELELGDGAAGPSAPVGAKSSASPGAGCGAKMSARRGGAARPR